MQHTVKDILASRPTVEVVTVKSTDNFYVALWKLHKQRCSAAPVWDDKAGKFTGAVDVLDLVTFALMTFEDRRLLKMTADDFFSSEAELAMESVKSMADMSLRSPFVQVSSAFSLESLIAVFGTSKDLHRVFVIDNDPKKIEGVISQIDVVTFLLGHYSEYSHLLRDSRVDESWAKKKMVQVNVQSPINKAFELLVDQKVTAAPVVDDEGRLLATLSATDLKFVEPGLIFRSLTSTVGKFLKSLDFKSTRHRERAQVTCRINDRLTSVIEKMVKYRVHRVWVVDERNVIEGVVSLTDIFANLKKESQ